MPEKKQYLEYHPFVAFRERKRIKQQKYKKHLRKIAAIGNYPPGALFKSKKTRYGDENDYDYIVKFSECVKSSKLHQFYKKQSTRSMRRYSLDDTPTHMRSFRAKVFDYWWAVT